MAICCPLCGLRKVPKTADVLAMSAPHPNIEQALVPPAAATLLSWPVPHQRSTAAPKDEPADEEARLDALKSLQILDSSPEPEFDDIVQLAAAICGSPVSLISLVDRERQWFKAAHGLDVREMPRETAFCHHAIQQPGLMLVEDATLDARFATNPMVTGTAGWRFYAGVPVEAPSGQPVGSLCVLDHVPRTLSSGQREALRILADQVNARLELRAQRLALEAALRDAEVARDRAQSFEQRFQAFMDSGPFLAYIKDGEGRMLYYTRRFAELFAVSREAMLHKTDHELWPAHLASAYRRHDQNVLRTAQLHVTEEETCSAEGLASTWRSYKFPCPGSDGSNLLGGVSIDVTEEKERQAELRRYQLELEVANQHLSELASVDALTQLPNRRTFDDALRRAFRHARKNSLPLCLMMVDVDRFKSHNDRFGHAHGDEVLRTLAAHLRAQLRVDDLVARYGGEEFVILLPETDEENAVVLAKRLVDSVRELKWQRAPVTVSVGLSALNPATTDAKRLLSLADEALYAAKCSGRDRAISYTQILTETLASAREEASARSYEGM